MLDADTTTSMPSVRKAGDLAGKYLTLYLAEERYALDMMKIEEIIGCVPITRVPRSNGSIEGVINLRGKIIPIVNLRSLLGLAPVEHDEKTCFIVVRTTVGPDHMLAGIIVDRVHEVVLFDESSLRVAHQNESSDGDTQDARTYMLGMGNIGTEVCMLLDIDEIISEIVENRKVGWKVG